MFNHADVKCFVLKHTCCCLRQILPDNVYTYKGDEKGIKSLTMTVLATQYLLFPCYCRKSTQSRENILRITPHKLIPFAGVLKLTKVRTRWRIFKNNCFLYCQMIFIVSLLFSQLFYLIKYHKVTYFFNFVQQSREMSD